MSLAARAEVLKLARLLHRRPEDLREMEAVPAEDLAALREQVTDALFDGDRDALGRIADAGRVVPVGFMATVGQKVFGPMLCARLTGLLDADRALQVGLRLPPPFLAEVAAELDPRRAIPVVTRFPAELAEEVAAVMAERGEHVAMGRFVAHLDDEALERCNARVGDADLLRTAFVLEGKDRIDRLVAALPDDRVARVVEVATAAQLLDEALDLLAHLGDEQLDRLARLVADRDPEPFAGLARVATEHGMTDVLDRARHHGVPLPA